MLQKWWINNIHRLPKKYELQYSNMTLYVKIVISLNRNFKYLLSHFGSFLLGIFTRSIKIFYESRMKFYTHRKHDYKGSLALMKANFPSEAEKCGSLRKEGKLNHDSLLI